MKPYNIPINHADKGTIMSNMTSVKEITRYIENNYLTIEQIANRSNLSLNQFKALINHACIPKHSHTITKQIIFHTDIFGDSVFTEEVFYYHPSLIKFAIKASQYLQDENFIEVAKKIKADFVQELHQALIDIKDAKSIFNDCFDEDGNLLEKGVEKIMTEHWPYIMNGTYGVCLKEISAKNMLLKNIGVSILEEWISRTHNKDHLNEKVQYAAKLYDSVAAQFGPHEILKSTRGRLFNQIAVLAK